VGSFSEVHQRTFLMFKVTVESRLYLRATATNEGEKDAQIPVGYNTTIPDLLTLGASSSDAVGSGFCQKKFARHLKAVIRVFWHRLLPRTFHGSTPSMLVRHVAIPRILPPISPTFPQGGDGRGAHDRYELFEPNIQTPPPLRNSCVTRSAVSEYCT
jgi:hypothetical protein